MNGNRIYKEFPHKSCLLPLASCFLLNFKIEFLSFTLKSFSKAKYTSIDEIMVISVAQICPTDKRIKEWKYLANIPIKSEAGIILQKSINVFFSSILLSS